MEEQIGFDAIVQGGRMWQFGNMQVIRVALTDKTYEYWVRNRAESGSTTLCFSEDEWKNLVKGVRAGEFDVMVGS